MPPYFGCDVPVDGGNPVRRQPQRKMRVLRHLPRHCFINAAELHVKVAPEHLRGGVNSRSGIQTSSLSHSATQGAVVLSMAIFLAMAGPEFLMTVQCILPP